MIRFRCLRAVIQTGQQLWLVPCTMTISLGMKWGAGVGVASDCELLVECAVLYSPFIPTTVHNECCIGGMLFFCTK